MSLGRFTFGRNLVASPDLRPALRGTRCRWLHPDGRHGQNGQLVGKRDANGNQSTVQVNAAGLAVAEWHPGAAAGSSTVVRKAYGVFGNLHTVTAGSRATEQQLSCGDSGATGLAMAQAVATKVGECRYFGRSLTPTCQQCRADRGRRAPRSR